MLKGTKWTGQNGERLQCLVHAYSGFENGMGLKQRDEIGSCSSSETQGESSSAREDHGDKLPAEVDGSLAQVREVK